MSSKLFLFLASGDEAFCAEAKSALMPDFDLNIFTNGAACFEALRNRQPDLVVLDARLPDCDALALHREIRDDFDTGDVFQLLLLPPERIGAEPLVCDDFLPLPVSVGTLREKLLLVKRLFAQRQSARDQLSYAQHVAMTAMSSMGELGMVMQFLSHSFSCANIQSVADLAVESLRQFGLEGAVHCVWEGDSHTQTTHGGPLPQEHADVIEQMRTLGRLFDLKDKLIVNFDHVSILITNMPEEDAERCGRIRDNVATLAEGIEARLLALLIEHDNLLKQQGIRYAVGEIRDTVRDLYARQIADIDESRATANKVIDDFEDAFVHMGMVPEVENQLIGQLVRLRQHTTDIVGRRGDVHDKLKSVIQSLETLAGDVGAPA